MKKRKHSAHLDIGIFKIQRKCKRQRQKQIWFTHSAKINRDFFGSRCIQKCKIWLYLERKEKHADRTC